MNGDASNKDGVRLPEVDVDDIMLMNDDLLDGDRGEVLAKKFQLHQLQQMHQHQHLYNRKSHQTAKEKDLTHAKQGEIKLKSVLDEVLGEGDSCKCEPHELDNEYLLPTVDCKPLQKWSGAEANSLIHFYRGELGRMTLYRVRLDASTNWAVTTTSVLTVLALGTAEVPHYFFGFIWYMNAVFLIIESRRFYLVKQSTKRVNCIEKGFFGGIVLPQAGYDHSQDTLNRVHQDWRIQLHNLLVNPKKRYLAWAALYNRLSRNYGYLFFASYVGWLFKLSNKDNFPWELVLGIGLGMIAVAIIVYIFRPLHDDSAEVSTE